MKQYKIDLRYFNSLIIPLPPGFNLIPMVYLYNQFTENETMCCGFDFYDRDGNSLGVETLEQKFHIAGNKIAPKKIPTATSYFLAWAYPKNEKHQEQLLSLSQENIFQHVYKHSNSINYTFENGTLGGINYQFFPTNGLTSNSSSTIMQSPKVFVDSENTTVVSFTYYTLNRAEKESAHLTISLRNQKGEEVFQSQTDIKPGGIYYEIFSHKLSLKGWYTLFAICTNRSLVPITFLINQNKSITIDHSMPPVAYSTLWNGEKRAKSINFLKQQFQGSNL